MAASGPKLTGVGVSIYRTAVIGDKTEANIVAALIAANQIDDAATITPTSTTRGTYSKQPMGQDINTPIPGRIELGECTFSVYYDGTNTRHTAIHNDDKFTDMTYIIVTSTGTSDRTFYAFDGFVTVANLVTPGDEQVMLEATVMLTTEVTAVDES